MKIKIIFIDSAKEKLTARQKYIIRNIIKKHSIIACKKLKVPQLTFTIYPEHTQVIPETGEVGFIMCNDWIQICVDPKRLADIKKNLPATVYHEINHLKRIKKKFFGNLEQTLLQSVVLEGLGTIAGEENIPNYPAIFGKYSNREIKKYLPLFKKTMHKKKYDRDEWFYGAGTLPRWIGYKIGSYIIRQAKLHTGLTTDKMVKMPAEMILKLSRI